MAVAEELVILVKAEVDNAVSKLGLVDKQTKKTLKSFLDFIPGPIKAAASIAGLISIGKDLVSSYQQQETALAGLKSALMVSGDYTEDAVASFSALASELQKTTVYGDEVTIAAAAMLKQLSGLSNKGVEKLLPKIQDLASAMGMDLNMAASLVGKTLGSSTNALARYGIEIDMTGSESEKLAQLTDQLTTKFGGMAEAVGQTSLGEMQKMKNALGDLKEIGGEAIAEFLNPFVIGITNAAQKLAEAHNAAKAFQTFMEGGGIVGDSADLIAGLQQQLDSLRLTMSRSAGVPGSAGIIESMKAEEARLQALITALKSYNIESDFASRHTASVAQAVKDFKPDIQAYADRLHAVDIELGAVDKSEQALGDTTKKDLLSAINDATDGLQAYADALTFAAPPEIVSALLTQKETVEDLTATYEEYFSLVGDGFADVAETLVDFAQGEKTAEEALEALKETAKETTVAILKALGEEAIAKAAFYAVAAIAGDPTAIAKAAGYGAAGVTAYAGAGVVAALADGGVVTKPTYALIGEAGPEAVVPLDKAGSMGNTYIIQGSVIMQEELERVITRTEARAARGY